MPVMNRLISIPVMLFALAVVGCETDQKTDPGPTLPAISPDDPLLSLDFEEFDQTPNQGWRILAQGGQYLEAAQLIDAYIIQHPALDSNRQRVLVFHAGQMYAFGNEYVIARDRFRLAINPNESRDDPIRWNAYVNGTIAFLEGNKAGVVFARSQIRAGPTVDGVKPNLNFIESFLTDVNQSYASAYTNARPPKLVEQSD